ncbi:MAG: siphovirus ReqiPepy6 Gp37-like family protein [Clostridia bacterium]|nr:siphovirus ReqiPepy6 Gp37-like family protein [Clostridia bacterium]
MLMQIFKPLEDDTQTFPGNKLGDVPNLLSYEYHKKWRSPGTFTAELPLDAECAGMLEADLLLHIDGDTLIVRDIRRDDRACTVTGEDLKGYTRQRITLYGEAQDTGTQGYDVVQGTTETCVKHYVDRNLVNPSDPHRRIPGMIIADNQERGLPDDRYMARLQPLSDVLEELCDGAQCGYDITADWAQSRLVFDFAAPVDKTGTNIVRDRVVFAKKRGNVLGLCREQTTSNYKNVFYATRANGTLAADAVTKMVLREGASTPGGPYRREQHVTVSPDSVEDMDRYARKEAESYTATDSFEVTPEAAADYGIHYTVGDVVTVLDEFTGQTTDKIITEARKEYTPGGRRISLTLGDKKPKPLNALNQKAEQTHYDVTKLTLDAAGKEDVRQEMAEQTSLFEVFNGLMAESCGLYQTVETDDDGGKIYYFHDRPTLADSTKIWKRTANGFAASNDGGQTWNSGHTVDGNVIAQMLIANKIQSPTDPSVYIDLLNGIIAAKYLMDSTTSSKVQLGSDGTTSEGMFLIRDGIMRMMLSSQPYDGVLSGWRSWLLTRNDLHIQGADNADGIPLRIILTRNTDGEDKIAFELDGTTRGQVREDGYHGWIHTECLYSETGMFRILFDESSGVCHFQVRQRDGTYADTATMSVAGFLQMNMG